MNTKCARCDYDVVDFYKRTGFDGHGLLGGYCRDCYPESVFARGADRIDFLEPITVGDGESVHDAIMRAIADGKAKVVYRERCEDPRCVMPKGHNSPHMGKLEMWPNPAQS
jgi:hypothetical protein